MSDSLPKKIAVLASESPEAQAAKAEMADRYKLYPPSQAELIIALGGDGHMLATLHSNLYDNKPIFGMNRGTVGFLMNAYSLDDLGERLEQAEEIAINPLRMTAKTNSGATITHIGINDVSLLRETRQAAKIRIEIDGKLRMEEMVGDGILVSTAAGSTAYNFSAGGPILPIGTNLLALTPISAFRPRRWGGALLPNNVTITLTVNEPRKRPVSAVADMSEVRDVRKVTIREARDIQLRLLFDPDHNLEDRVLGEQFAS